MAKLVDPNESTFYKVNIPTSQARTNVAYGTLTTPDQVLGVSLPNDGMIFVFYQATWQESVAGVARAAIFLGANQLKIYSVATAGPVTQAARIGAGAVTNQDDLLASSSQGLISVNASVGYTGDITTGQALAAMYVDSSSTVNQEINGGTVANTAGATGIGTGGACMIFAAAGTYDISIQFKSSSGTVTVKNRHLWVWTKS